MTSAPEIVPPPTLADAASPPAADLPDERPTNKSTRPIAATVGLLFLAATAAFIAADTLNASVLSRPDFLTGAATDTPVLATGALLVFASPPA